MGMDWTGEAAHPTREKCHGQAEHRGCPCCLSHSIFHQSLKQQRTKVPAGHNVHLLLVWSLAPPQNSSAAHHLGAGRCAWHAALGCHRGGLCHQGGNSTQCRGTATEAEFQLKKTLPLVSTAGVQTHVCLRNSLGTGAL